MFCIFCIRSDDFKGQVTTLGPGPCTYGLKHEFNESVVQVKQQQPKKDSGKNLCIKCGMHPKNPKAVGCDHTVLNK